MSLYKIKRNSDRNRSALAGYENLEEVLRSNQVNMNGRIYKIPIVVPSVDEFDSVTLFTINPVNLLGYVEEVHDDYIIADIPDIDEGIIAKLRPNLDHMYVSACAICESNKVLTVIKMVIEPDREEDQNE